MIKAVVFDLDDTLTSEREYVKSGYKHIANILSSRYKINQQTIYQRLIKLLYVSPKNVFNRLLEQLNIICTQKDIMELVEAYRSHKPEIQFYDDVIPCLNMLKAEGKKTGVITDGYTISQKNKLKTLDAEKYFDHIIITNELGRQYWKPHSKAFLLMRDKLDVEFSEMIYVGDNPDKDFYISSIYPINTVRIVRQGFYDNRSYFKNIKENFLIHNLREIFKIMNGVLEGKKSF